MNRRRRLGSCHSQPGGSLRAAIPILAWTALLSLALGSPTQAQFTNRPGPIFYPDDSETADALLRNAAAHARDQQWSETIEIYQRVIQQFGDKVARLPRDEKAGEAAGESVLFVDVREYCQRKIAELPPEARKLYQSRVDVQAERWFRQAAEERDRSLLRRVIDQAFCSSWGDDAENLLGDLAFQDGRFEEAIAAYRVLVPDRPDNPAGLTHPDPSVDLAQVAAKKLLCRAALGTNPPGAQDLDTYAKQFPNAAGSLAGREGPYLETLRDALQQDRLTPSEQPDGRWPTFAGSPTRNRIAPGGVDVGSLQWRVDLEPIAPRQGQRYARNMILAPPRPDRLLAYHPIVVGDQVIVNDESEVRAFNLNDRPDPGPGPRTGTVSVAWRQDQTQGADIPRAVRPSINYPRYTLTAYGDRIYARMGMNAISFGHGSGSQSYLIALDRSTDGKLLWKKPSSDVMLSRKPNEAGVRGLGFEGSPIADARNVYVALTSRNERTNAYVACLEAETGATRWVRYLGAGAPTEGENPFGMGMPPNFNLPAVSDFGHRLLTLDGPTLYLQTNLGAVAAIDAESGSIKWIATYPRQDRQAGSSSSRDLNPAIVHDGLVIIAPDDAPSIYAFDATSGRLVWKTDPIPDEVRLAHLLGVAQGRLVATGDRVMLFDAKNGKLVHSWPDNGNGYEGFGRGLLAGDKIYWPTRNEIHVLDQATGLRTDPPIKLQESFQETGGNLVLGDGFLIVAQSDKLVVYCQNRRLIERYREEIARTPDQAIPYYRMAQAAEATGQDELALESLGRAQERARPSETIDGAPLVDAARDQRFRLLVKIGEKLREAHDFALAEKRFHDAALTARSDRDRLRAHLLESEVQLARGNPRAAVATLQELLANARLRNLSVVAEEGRRSIRSDLYIADRLSTILKSSGREVYRSYDAQAAELLKQGNTAEDPRQIEEISRSYPVAAVVPESLLALGRLYESRKQPGDAARAYKRLLNAPTDDAIKARGLLGLARAYEAQELWVPARDALTQALARYPRVEIEIEEVGSSSPLSTVVARRLADPVYQRLLSDRPEPSLPVPLDRHWSKTLEKPARLLVAEGVPPSPRVGRIFLARDTTIQLIDLEKGELPWTANLDESPTWVGFLSDRALAATENRLVALDLKTGDRLWQFEANPSANANRGVNPFEKGNAEVRGEKDAPPRLLGFHIVGDRVFFLRGNHEMLAIDGDSGQIDWAFLSPLLTLNPNVLIGPRRIVAQLLKSSGSHTRPDQLLVLETTSGRRLGEFAQEGDEAWPRPPLWLDDDHVVLTLDRRTITLYDVTRGANAWMFRETKELPRYAPPRPLGDSEHLLVVQDGTELIHLDATTGAKHWARPLGVTEQDERVPSIVTDADRVYWINGRNLNAASLKDGGLIWSRPLLGPELGWSIELSDRCVVAYPGLKRGADDPLEALPLTFCLRTTGDVLQRVLLSTSVVEAALRIAPGETLVATQSGLWSLGARRPMDEPAVPR